jgi:hypothetical protein
MFRRLLLAITVCSVAANASAQEQDSAPKSDDGRWVWALGSAGFGFGSLKPGGLHAQASGEAQVWVLDDVGVGARYSGLATGAPDGGSGGGSAITGLLSYRHGFGEIEHVAHTQKWFLATLGVGAAHLSGYTGRIRGDGDFDVRDVVLMPRLAMLMSWRFVTFGAALDFVVMPKYGVAGSASMLAGAIF